MTKFYSKGEIVIRQGDNKDRLLYRVIKGKFLVQKVVNNMVIDCGYFRSGDVFGEISLIIGAERAATIVASDENCEVEVLDRKSFLEKIKENPEIAWQVLTSLAIRTQKLDELQGQISDPQILRMILLGKE
jgi:CRP-like cAMP-binding protein